MKLDRTLGVAMLAIGSLMLAQGALAGGGQPLSNIFIGPDTNGDGASDPIIEDSASGFAIAYEMNGLVQLQAAAVPGTYTGYTTVDWADVDGDGKSDKVIHHTSGYEMAFLAPPDITTTAAGAWSFLVVPGSYGTFSTLGFRDIDGDGKADKIMEDAAGYTVAIRTNATPFDDAVSIPGSYGNFVIRAGIDIDGDNNVDKVMEDSVTGYTVVTLLEDVIANSVSDEIPGSYGTFEMTAFADVNGDGNNDKIMEIQSGGADDGYTLGVMLQDDLTYTMIELPASYNGAETLGYPDLNGDGQADQVIRASASETAAVQGCIYGSAAGAQMAVTCGAITPVPAGQVFEGFADLNGDKKVDRVTRDTTTGDLYGILHDGLTDTGTPTIIVSAPASTYDMNPFDDFWDATP